MRQVLKPRQNGTQTLLGCPRMLQWDKEKAVAVPSSARPRVCGRRAWNSSFGGKILGCFRNCGLSDCWDDHFSAALLVRVPAIIPLPITKKTKQTKMTLYRERNEILE